MENTKETLMYSANEIMNKAQEWGLETEVLVSAVENMKENPEITPLLAIQMAASDWDLDL